MSEEQNKVETPEQLSEYIQQLLNDTKKQYEEMTDKVVSAIDEIAARVESLEQNVNSLLEGQQE